MNTNARPFKDAINALTDLVTTNKSGIDDFKLELYLDWITTKTSLLEKEAQPIHIPDTKLPKTISLSTYNYLKSDLQKIVNIAYDKFSNQLIRNSSPISISDSTSLYKSLYLVKRNVVWVDFGFNVGSEFGGRHPAIILKNLGEVLIVAPISTNTNGIQASNTVITFLPNEVYGLPSLRQRFTNITRITPVSMIRVDFNSSIGSIKSQKFNEILGKIKNFY